MAVYTPSPCDKGVLESAPAAAHPCQARSRTGLWVLIATILGSSMAFIDGTAVNVALPALQADLGMTAAGAQWVVESYALFLAALMLVGGSLGDLYGRKRIFGLGVLIFAAASLACGLAPTTGVLIAARSVQGIGGALLVPGSLAILSAAFDDEERGRAIGLWSGFTAITAALGPVLGGWLVDNVSWRWVFYLNLPVAAVVLGILLYGVPESRDETAERLDWPGAVLATLGLGGLVFGLIEAGHLGPTHPAVLGALLLGVACLAGFLWVEARSSHPMMPLGLYRSRDFSGANLLTLLLYSALGGALFFLPFNLILVQDYSATAAGAAFLPFILIIFVLSPWAGGLVARYGGRRPLVIGPLIAAGGFALFTRAGEVGGSYWTTYFPAIVVLGVGMAITVAPLTTVVMQAVDVQQSGVASGVNNTVSRTASLIAVAAMGLVMAQVFQTSFSEQLLAAGAVVEAQVILDDPTLSWIEPLPPTGDAAADAAAGGAWESAFLAGFQVVMWIAVALALLASLTAGLMIQGKPAEAEAETDLPAPRAGEAVAG